ncbi:ABC transporter permease [Clostridium algidicarnis]|uniref:ABC transporter permease n=1 Tax=Clostridium algidicarnis TaxID=37659 RepID=UPI001C0D7457|nr:ABC transporter permease [Clostridium algidicarnis]MBU3209913.1 ABC transporter permease [Clostridium algidicarnis]
MNRSITLLVFKKELMDIFRDKKTLISSIVIPLIIFPLLFMVMGKSISKTSKSVEDNLKISISDKSNSDMGQFIKDQKGINLIETDSIEEDMKSGKILMALEIPEGFENSISKEEMVDVIVTYDNSSQQSQMALSKVEGYIDVYSKEVVAKRLQLRGIKQELLTPVNLEVKTFEKESEGFSKFMLSLLLPLLLVMYSVSGPIAPATDLGAGEKERGTLEPLLTTKASRMSLLWGKFLAITVMGLVTTIASLAGVMIAMKQSGGLMSNGNGSAASFSIEPKAMILIGIVAILTTMVFGALELSISIYARSFKEAQTYLTPLTIITIIPVYATYMLDPKSIENFYFHIPLANSVCLLKELIMGIYNYNHILTTLGWTIAYIVISLLFARFMFSREEVVFRA